MIGSEEEKTKGRNNFPQKEKEVDGLLAHLQKMLNEHIKQVRISDRLGQIPARLVGTEVGSGLQLESLLQKDGARSKEQRVILELNPDHPIFFKMCKRFDKNEHDAALVACAELLLGYALLAEGAELPDPSRFNRLLAGCILHIL
jgi:molecular chaperone HtpG